VKKVLNDILPHLTLHDIRGNSQQTVDRIVFDSRQAGPGALFFAIRGTNHDGHRFIPAVMEAGCTALIVEDWQECDDTCFMGQTNNSQEALAMAAAAFYDFPSNQIQLIGITGTNGKTTTSTLLFDLFTSLGYKCGLLSTVVNKIGTEQIPATHTTPDPVSLNRMLAEMNQAGCSHCFMEVSSHAVHQQRITGLTFRGGVFTNITHDHLDYHQTFAAYLTAKKGFFDLLGNQAFALTNADDKNGQVMLQNTKAKKYSYALKNMADFRAKIIENQFNGLFLSVDGTELNTRLIGDFNAYNLLAVYGVSQLLGEDKWEVLTVLSAIQAVEGRFQQFRSDSGIMIIVDYAHTPDALENVLQTIQNIRQQKERVFSVVGCGGDRDREKRPIMAQIACRLSDQVLITSDNPRSEEPVNILSDMMQGITDPVDEAKTLSIEDRMQAIKAAISMAQQGDIVLIAGKGHEKYQEIKGVRYPFDDMANAKEICKKLGK
jgi:UDP-N-acetylmuramoyl-L-alanyl-D-glutamate--2,6-diaminopimelate ligase